MSEFDYEKAWTSIQGVFPVLNNPPIFEICKSDVEEYLNVLNVINSMNICEEIQDLILDNIETFLRREGAPKFWSYFKRSDCESSFNKFHEAVSHLRDVFQNLNSIMRSVVSMRDVCSLRKPIYNQKCPNEALKLMIKATLLSQLPINHQWLITEFYEAALKSYDADDHVQCAMCSRDSCNCTDIFMETNRSLVQLGLIEPLISQPLTDLIYSYVQNHIQKISKGNFDVSHIENLEHWLHCVVIPWLRRIYFDESNDSSGSASFMDEFDKKLRNYLYNTYTKVTIDQLFNIIIEYPESAPAIEDLKLCLPKTDLKPYLTKTLKKAMETRLLHLGVGTSDILVAYVAAILSLRYLDPSGLLLETISQPVHQYLRSREDTIRCVIGSLTEDSPNDLADELVRVQDENVLGDEDTQNWETWTPDPVEGAPGSTSGSRRTSDIISMLVNVYGSKDLFVNEYRTLLADRLLSQYSCDTEKEIRNLELLKLRFGDSQLHLCEVMLKDIADSKRINQNIKQDGNYTEDEVPMSAMIVSAQFWPPFKDEKLEVHRKLSEQMESYTNAFKTLKGNRTLCWKNHLGVVELEIELRDRTLSLSVSPFHATILMHFQDQNTWTLEKLGKVMNLGPTTLRRKLSFWQSHGIISESEPDVFKLQEEQQENHDNNMQNDIVIEDYESESAMASAQDQREEELQTFWSYILGMLMNLDTLPLERIHQMLRMFAFQGPTIECNLQELKLFLDRKVREHQLIFSNGLYRLPK